MCTLLYASDCYAGYDCGVYSMLYAQALCSAKLKEGEPEREAMMAIAPKAAQEWRAQTKSLIVTLAEKS